MAWVSPTGHNDPDNKWSDEGLAYDGNTGTDSQSDNIDSDTWGSFLELTINAIDCDKLRFYAKSDGTLGIYLIDLDVYYNGGWQHLYQGEFADEEWVEKAIGSTQSVTAARVRFYNEYHLYAYANMHELEFNQVIVAVGRSFGFIIG